MTFTEFEKIIIERLQEEFGEEREIRINDVYKNNGIILRGITVCFDELNACPTLYIDDMYERHEEDGVDIDIIVADIIKSFKESRLEDNVDVSYFSDYEEVGKRILCKLINTEKNRELLMDVPHVDYLDLSCVFYIIATNGKNGVGTILIHNSHMKPWGVTIERMFEDAKRNTNCMLKGAFVPIEELLFNMMTERNNECMDILNQIDERKEAGEIFPMYVLSNSMNSNGAACLLDEELLNDFAKMVNSDFYIIPSSIHELILVPKTNDSDIDSLKEIVKEVNATEVAPSEVLSDNVYLFSKNLKNVMCM